MDAKTKIGGMSTEEKDLVTRKNPSPPPAYDIDPPDITAAFSSLKLEDSDKPTPDQCIAHLKLLEAFHQLREDVATNDGLFGLRDDFVPQGVDEQQRAETLLKIREKRWAIYVAKAARRFERWWQVSVEPGVEMLSQKAMAAEHFDHDRHPLFFSKEALPPLDVIMVWHSYMLNPRDFLEDCVRHQKMNFWREGLPLAAINDCIDNSSFEYTASDKACQFFESETGHAWNSLHDPPNLTLECPGCSRSLPVPWTTCTAGSVWSDRSRVTGQGFSERQFRAQCWFCNVAVDHELLRTQKFRKDVQRLLLKDVPMPGTILNIDGRPELLKLDRREPKLFPNRLIKTWLAKTIVAKTDPRLSPSATVDNIRKLIEEAIANPSIVRKVNESTFSSRLQRTEKIATRRMMSRYWENSSIFALDLVGAVIRQSSFIEKMHAIDWIHSPTVSSTMSRLITKYERYFHILAVYPTNIAVPTLDVDLAWHTHQVSPKSYFAYSLSKTQKFIDHDDKIDEVKLSTAFEWTSKTYQKLYSAVYSECTCWYCEAVRESHTSSISRLFKSNSNIEMDLDRLHSSPTDTSNPHTTPHISAHNAIKPTLPRSTNDATIKAVQLERNYNKARQQAMKKGREPPARSEYMMYYGYGYPIYMPYYVPYMGDPCVTQGFYAGNPGCANFTPGAVGNCCAGACGGGVAAGACGGTGAGGCSGGVAGGCGGGGGGDGDGGGCGGGGCGGGG